jgi:hypothetical protein
VWNNAAAIHPQPALLRPAPQKFELLAKNPLGEASNSTPAISDGDFFVRTMKGLHCIAQ